MRLNHPELVVYEHPAHLVSSVVREGSVDSNHSELWFGIVEPPRTHVIDLYTPCFRCIEVVREGSRRFEEVRCG